MHSLDAQSHPSEPVAFISDVHGNYAALSAVLAELDARSINRIFCAGDVAGYYPKVNECCDELRERGVTTVMGNHDWYLGGSGACQRSKSANACIDYQRTVISDSNRLWLRALPITIDEPAFRLVHGGWEDPIDEYLEPNAEYFDQLSGKLFISGHTHVARISNFAGKTHCNPGSVGQPRDGDARASFAQLRDGQLSLHRVEYDIDAVAGQMEAAGFDEHFFGGLYTGARQLQRGQ